jgi:ketosteroid isomerase-like protein
MKISENVQFILDVLKNEVDGDVQAALEKITDDYTMTWVYQTKSNDLFPTTTNDMEAELEEVYTITGRQYDIRNIAESDSLVMLELIESYPDPKTGQVYRTPQVIVLELKDGKIRKGRHYCDPHLSHLKLSVEQIETDALKGTKSKHLIK